MADCILLTREMLREPIDLDVPDAALDFARARAIAEARARQEGPSPCSWPGMTGRPARFRPR